MRPKLLEIEGLQSFQNNQIIDFDNLGETGLFGIFGPTGSGKSTVLDAITFALYGKVKRADRGTRGIINSNMNNVKVSFTFELKRGNEKKLYKVERNYQRKKGNDSSCEAKIARLIEVASEGDKPICDKASEVSNSIEELLGLNHEDFTRAVVLPQNSFHEFLMLDNSKKREMLERIFYLEEYGKHLLEKVNKKMSKLKSQGDIISGELKGYEDATDEKLKEAKEQMSALIEHKEQVEKQYKELEKEYVEAKELWQISNEMLTLEEKEKEHNKSSVLINQMKVKIDRAKGAEELSEIIKRNKEIKNS